MDRQDEDGRVVKISGHQLVTADFLLTSPDGQRRSAASIARLLEQSERMAFAFPPPQRSRKERLAVWLSGWSYYWRERLALVLAPWLDREER